ncbi:hypothetical protein KC901_03530 [Patescibacteria group bacterium]|nr:hypothetical protein [Patescibacteria group bacterium]MCA9353227.1 hypothetical protein [Patescibacteria group bacterium]
MKRITLITRTLALALVFGIGVHTVMAIETDAELQTRIAELRQSHADLKAQVEAGELTVEEARETWRTLLEEARAEKEAFFETKRQQIEDRYEQMVENNPERAEIFKQHINAMRDRHEARVENRAELRAQVAAGEITRQEANNMRVEFVQQQRDNAREFRADLKEQRQERRDEFMESRDDRLDRELTRPVDPIRPDGTRPVEPMRPNTGLDIDIRPAASLTRPAFDAAGAVRVNDVRRVNARVQNADTFDAQ